MGEMADFAQEEIWDHNETSRKRKYSKMTIETAFGIGLIDECSKDVEKLFITRTCRLCGKAGLRWAKNKDKWRLYEGSKIHSCKETKNS